MSNPFIGEIRMFGGNFAPAGWAFCEGQLLPISENDALFTLIGTTYGGDGQETFALPDLRGRLPIHQGNGFVLAQTGGTEEVTLTVQQIPSHTHALLASSAAANSTAATNMVPAKPDKNLYRPGPANVPMAAQAVGPAGGSQPHTNFQPYLCINFIISLFGIFPPPS
ncbi:MAG TPA: tail fiber protein [Chthoniobacterales bacterium]|nr:tail fiber protein [Chthoniobacterales bacterium]